MYDEQQKRFDPLGSDESVAEARGDNRAIFEVGERLVIKGVPLIIHRIHPNSLILHTEK